MAETFDSTGRQDLIDDAIEIAQAAPGIGGEPIGQVETLAGTVVAIRTDGSRVELEVGDSIFQGDTLESGADGAIGVVLADQTTFSMAEDGQMGMDEMVYDPGTQEGSIAVSVLQGVFTFVSGEIAKADPDSMTLDTPVATIGIRGTQVALSYDPTDTGGEGLRIVLMAEKDGFVGEVVVSNAAGLQILNLPDQGTTVASATAAPAQPIQFDRIDIVNAFRGALGALPTENNNANTYGVEPTTEEETVEEEAAVEELTEEELAEEGEAEEEFETAAGEEEIEEEIEEELAEEGIDEEEFDEEEFDEEELAEEDVEDLADIETAAGGPTDLGGDTPPPTTDDGTPTDPTIFVDPLDTTTTTTTTTTDPTVTTDTTTTADDTAAIAAAAALLAEQEAAAAEALRQATADEPTLTVGPASGSEDPVGGIPLDLSAISTDTVGNETLTVTIAGVPSDAVLTYVDAAGQTQTLSPTDVGGIGVIALGPDTYILTADQLSGLSITPAQDFNGDIQLTVTATSTVSDREDGDSVTTEPSIITVTVEAVNDAPDVQDDDYVTSEGSSFSGGFGIGDGLLDNDFDVEGDPFQISSVQGLAAR